MKNTLKTFPDVIQQDKQREYICLLPGEVEEIVDWKNAFEKELTELYNTTVKKHRVALETWNKKGSELARETACYENGRRKMLKEILGLQGVPPYRLLVVDEHTSEVSEP